MYDRALSSDEIKELYYNYSPKELNSGKFLDSINLEQEDKLLFSKAETESEFSLDFENGYLSNVGKKLKTDNLVAYWSFDDFTGGSGVTKDTSGNGNDATIYSTAISRDGVLGKSVEIENDYITTNVGLTDSGTISVWINPNFDGGAGIEYPIIDATYGGSRWFSIGLGGGAIGSGNIGFSLEDAGDLDYTAMIPSSIIESGNWYHLIGTWVIGSPIKFYLNGDLMASSQNLASFDLDTLGSKIRIGEYSGDYAFYPPHGNFDGKIDEVFVLNRALTATEVEELYNSKKNLLQDKRIATGEIYGNPVIQGSGVDNLDDVNVKIYSSLEEENKNGFFDPTDGGDSIT
ncbi:MAG: LamG domain-containing protein, partial [Spirochaetia bacterium]|nr:LamG domain-containing protein [Spirochaetia bacterium]